MFWFYYSRREKSKKYARSVADRRYTRIHAKYTKKTEQDVFERAGSTLLSIVSIVQLQFGSHAAPQCVRALAVEVVLLQQQYIVRVSSDLM